MSDTDTRTRDLDDLLGRIRPYVEADGGSLDLVSVDPDTGVVVVELAGACGTCALSSSTLAGGVERILRAYLPWVTRVEGVVTDEGVAGYGAYVPWAPSAR